MILTDSQKRKIRQAAKTQGITAAMELANEMLQGHGVECIWGYAGILDAPDIEYVSMGDPYIPTVIYDRVTGRFLWGACWGDIVERREYDLWHDLLGRENGPYRKVQPV